MIVGVGGQGTLLASRILGSVNAIRGKDVKISEVHGMSQRGGSVVTYVRYGEEIYSPIIDKGCADYILAFEKLEGYRFLPYLKPTGKIIINDTEIMPMPVIMGKMEYPQDIYKKISSSFSLDIIPANELADELGNKKCQNVIIIGYFASLSDIPHDTWIEALRTNVKPEFLDLNLKAFDLGYNYKK